MTLVQFMIWRPTPRRLSRSRSEGLVQERQTARTEPIIALTPDAAIRMLIDGETISLSVSANGGREARGGGALELHTNDSGSFVA